MFANVNFWHLNFKLRQPKESCSVSPRNALHVLATFAALYVENIVHMERFILHSNCTSLRS
jgi:hypothetical protein